MICLTVYVWRFSFAWGFSFSVTHYVVGLLVVLIVGLIIGIIVDSKHDWQLKRYFIVSILQLLFIWAISNPIRSWQIDSSLEKGKLIIDHLETYKVQFGKYPTTLTELGEKINQNIPTRTNIGTRYFYQSNNGKDYILQFQSYYGYTAYYNEDRDDWIITD